MRYYFSTWQRVLCVVGTSSGAGLLPLGCTQLPAETRPSAGAELRLQAVAKTDTSGYEIAPPRDPNGIGTY